MTELSIIFPCYNEGSNLKQIIEEIKTIKNDNFNINIEFKVVDIKNNLGYGGGILEGVKSAKGKIISWTHADLQCDPNDVIKAYKKHKDKLLNQNFVVKGRRIKRKIINAHLFCISFYWPTWRRISIAGAATRPTQIRCHLSGYCAKRRPSSYRA